MEANFNYTEAQNDLAFLAQRFKGILALANYIKEIENLEVLADERQKFAAYLRDFANQEQVRLNEIQASITTLEAQAKETVDKANSEALVIVSKAKTDAEAIADKILADLEVTKQTKVKEIETLTTTVNSTKVELADLKTQVQAATQQLQTIRAELEKLRNSI